MRDKTKVPSTFKERLTGLLMLLFIVVAINLVAAKYFITPVVYFSHSTGECFRVDSINSEDSCENLPDEFIHRWSK